MADSIEDKLENFMNEQSPTSMAVRSLVDVKKNKSGETDTDIELKTDLDDKNIKLHTKAMVMNDFLESVFGESIIKTVVNIKERKLVSKDRGSRREIVEVARNPDMNMIQGQENMGFMKRLVTPRNKRIQ